MDEIKNFENLEEINAALAQLKDFFKDTINLYYDNITVKEFITYDLRNGLLVGQFLGEDGKIYSFQVDREGVPTLFDFAVPLDVLAAPLQLDKL